MNGIETRFKMLMREKFGADICANLCSEDFFLKPDNLNLQGDLKKAVASQIAYLSNKYFDFKLPMDLQWAFDFPSWIGTLDFQKENVKDIMIVGLEPHIYDRYYNIAYDMFEDHGYPKIKEPGRNFNIELSHKAENYRNSASRFWETMLSVFAGEDILREIQLGNRDALISELKRYYCTDMCFFTVKGDTEAIKKVPRWGAIRHRAALQFLFEEIECIRPKLVVLQGGAGLPLCAETLFNYKDPETFNGKYKIKNKYINMPCYYRGDRNVLFIPHTSSQNGDFWKKYLKDLRSDIRTLWPDIYN